MKFEEWLSQQNGVIEVDCGCVTTEAFYHWMRVAYEAGNSPAIPDGYVMVPDDLKEAAADLLATLDEYPEQLVPINRDSAVVRALRAAMLPENPVCTCPSGDGSLRWPCPVHPGNSPVIPDGSADMLRRWLAFGRGMQNAGSQLPHNLIAETESMLAAAPQPQNAPQNIPEIIPDCWCRTCRPVVLNDMRFVVCPDCGNKRCPRANDHRNACTGSNEPGQEGSAYPDTPREVKP
ncbi:TPA: hypothetical protein ACJCGP_000392 [Klebsiella pneumoniae]|uniref:hypothetical protein n=1 Tax=Klebsiella pneumoniae TaxID=573 RepID=UPI00389838F6